MPNSIARRALVSPTGNLLSALAFVAALLLALPAVSETPAPGTAFGPPARITVPFVETDRLAERLQRQGVNAVEASAIEKAVRKNLSPRERTAGALIEAEFAGSYGKRDLERLTIEPGRGKVIVLLRTQLGLPESASPPATAEATSPPAAVETANAAATVPATDPAKRAAQPATEPAPLAAPPPAPASNKMPAAATTQAARPTSAAVEPTGDVSGEGVATLQANAAKSDVKVDAKPVAANPVDPRPVEAAPRASSTNIAGPATALGSIADAAETAQPHQPAQDAFPADPTQTSPVVTAQSAKPANAVDSTTEHPAANAARLSPSTGFVAASGVASADLARSISAAGAPRPLAHEIAAAASSHPVLARAALRGSRFQIVFDPTANARFALAAFTVNGREHRLWRFAPLDSPPGHFTDDGERIDGVVLQPPLPGVSAHSPFGVRRHPVLGGRRMHWGVDYSAPAGTPIRAAADGTVVIARRNGNHGLYVRIDHGDGVATTYSHVQRFAPGIKAGARVKAGAVIANVGRTGMATGPHLCFEVFIGDRRVDPEPLLAEGGRRLHGADRLAFERAKERAISTEIAADSQI